MTALLAFLSLLAFAPDVTKEDVKKLVAAGVSENVIVGFVRSHGPVSALSPGDLIELREANVSENILSAMLDMSRTPPASTQAAPAQEYTPSVTDTYPWYYPYGYTYDSFYGPYSWWYAGPSYFRNYPYGYRYPYGYHYYPGYPYGYRWGPNGHTPDHTYVHPRGTPPRTPTIVPHSTPKEGGRH